MSARSILDVDSISELEKNGHMCPDAIIVEEKTILIIISCYG